MTKSIFISVILSLFFAVLVSGQNNEMKKIDCNKDTLLIIASKTLCREKNQLNRADLLESDSILINKNDLEIHSYEVNSFTLGNSLNMKVSEPQIPLKLKQIIASEEISYKYLDLKNIKLVDKQNNIVYPTLLNIKIVFND